MCSHGLIVRPAWALKPFFQHSGMRVILPRRAGVLHNTRKDHTGFLVEGPTKTSWNLNARW